MHVTYYVRNVYGADLLYPASDTAQMLCEIAGTKTLTPATMATLKAHGVTTSMATVRETYWNSRIG